MAGCRGKPDEAWLAEVKVAAAQAAFCKQAMNAKLAPESAAVDYQVAVQELARIQAEAIAVGISEDKVGFEKILGEFDGEKRWQKQEEAIQAKINSPGSGK